PYTEIEWAVGDKLPFPFCLSSVTNEGKPLEAVSVALGNIVLADHGMTILQAEGLGKGPSPNPVLAAVPASGRACGEAERPVPAPARFQPQLRSGSLTQQATITRTQEIQGRRTPLRFDPTAPASTVFDWDMEHVLPAVRLGDSEGQLWLPK